MAIKLKSLKLPATSGEWLQLNSRLNSGSGYQENGTQISEIYLQDSTGVLAGVRIGTEHNVWIPAIYSNKFFRGDKLKIGGEVYDISDIKEAFYRNLNGSIGKPNSMFESHYQLTILLPND
jgi:hypothetical protein